MAQCPYSYFDYKMEAGDTFSSLAEKFRVSEQAIIDQNKGLKPTAGHLVRIPCACGGCTRGTFYAIRKGESLLKIAQRNGLSLTQLLKANPYLNPNYYIPGQVIVVPQAPPRKKTAVYTLADGEGLFDVLRKFRMDLTMFCMMNPGINAMGIKAGQRVNVTPRSESSVPGRWYTVAAGESLVDVAQRHGISVSMLLAANENLRPSDFKPGARVRIPFK